MASTQKYKKVPTRKECHALPHKNHNIMARTEAKTQIMARTEAIKTKTRTLAVRARTEAQNIVKNLMTRTRNSTGELDKTIPDNEKGLMLMDALCRLHEDESDESDKEEDLPDWNFSAFDEGGHSDKTTNYKEFESLVSDETMDSQKPEHLDANLHAGFRKGNWLGMIKVIQNIVLKPSLTPSKPEFDFNINKEALHKNIAILKNYRYNMTREIAGNKGSTMWCGSEFRPQ
eukprot:15355959-Ditylum_brightwellii.AAC.1